MTQTLTERQQLVEKEIKKFKILEGGHGPENLKKKQTCIMEAICLVLGYNPYTDDGRGQSRKLAGYLNPPCISPTIKDFLVTVNDFLNEDRERSALKRFAPQILNTAPTVNKVRELKTKTVTELKQDKSNPEFKEAENKRRKMIRAKGLSTRQGGYYQNLGNFLYTDGGSFRKKNLETFLQELIDVAKF